MVNGRFDTMAKKKKDKQAKVAEAAAPESNGQAGSVLEQAWLSYQAGDMVTARLGAHELLTGKATPRDETFAQKLAPELFGKKDAPQDVPTVAKELERRTNPPINAYWFAALAVGVFIVLLLISRRVV